MFNLSWLKKHQYLLILVLIGVFFIIIYSWIFNNVNAAPKFNSPDETANYYFIKLLADKGQLKFFEPINQLTDGIIRPRSMLFANGYTVPGSFLGIILIYGTIAKIFGSSIIIYLTPIFSVIGILFFYLLLKKIFSKHIAFICSLLLFFLPPFWYYNIRGLFHNVLFIDLFIIGLYFFVYGILNQKYKKFYLSYLLGGIFIGLALITRTSEIFWVIGIFIILSFASRKILYWQSVITFFGIIIVIFIPILLLNHQLYGSATSFAYTNGPSTDTVMSSLVNSVLFKAKQVLLPFGVDWQRIGQMSYQYLICIFPWFSILLFIGIFWFLRNEIYKIIKCFFPGIKVAIIKLTKIQKIYIVFYIGISFWLIFYYGSYVFYEYLDKTLVILASSYTRYWLPIYIFGMPIAVMAIFKIAGLFKSKYFKQVIIFALPILFVFFSVNIMVNDPLYGLKQTRQYISDNVSLNKLIDKFTDKNGVVIAGSADKVVFPERKVIVSLPQDNWQKTKTINNLLGETKIYYLYNPLDDSAELLNFFKKNYHVILIKQFIRDQGTLYRIE